jgi:general secretion pathway protein J
VIGQLEQDLSALQETPNVPGLSFDGATLRLTRRADLGLQVVAWSLRPNADGSGSGTLLRWAGPPTTKGNELQETWMRTQQFQGTEAGQLRALTGLAQWHCHAFRGNAWTNCQSSGQGLPGGVRLLMEFNGSGLSGNLTRDIVLGP